MKFADIQEAHDFLAQHPEVRLIELILIDANGIPRGKLLHRDELLAIYENGRPLPSSPNDANDKVGGLNRAFTKLYKIRLRGKELKKRNRTRYYLEKWAIFGGLLALFLLI